MATKAEQIHSDAQRKGRGGRKSVRKPRKAAWDRAKGHAGAKATHALERASGRRPSRKSTRKSANRAKADAGFNLTEHVRRGAPQGVARKARVRRSRVRGSS
jgi:hypothetical protein